MAGGKLSAGATIVQVVFIIFNVLFSVSSTHAVS